VVQAGERERYSCCSDIGGTVTRPRGGDSDRSDPVTWIAGGGGSGALKELVPSRQLWTLYASTLASTIGNVVMMKVDLCIRTIIVTTTQLALTTQLNKTVSTVRLHCNHSMGT
jgi:hypothetical protein